MWFRYQLSLIPEHQDQFISFQFLNIFYIFPFFSVGPEPFLHLPVVQRDLVECWWVLLLCCGHRCHVSHLHSYLSVHYQKGELRDRLAVPQANSHTQRPNCTSRFLSFSSNTLCSMTWWQLTVLSVCLCAEPMMVCLVFSISLQMISIELL